MTEQPFLGLYMIVRDASRSIDALLDSVDGAFDEYVFVDTGSMDDTREKIARRLPSAVLASFDWIDDFAAARNYAFSLGTAKWRMYLDADDVAANLGRLRATIKNTERASPRTNVIVLPYDYTGNGDVMQDKMRIVRWADGWRWRDEIHEQLIRDPAGPRVMSIYSDLLVKHCHTAEDDARSLERNIRVCEAVRAKAIKVGDFAKAGLMAYYLGQYSAVLPGQLENAIGYYSEASETIGDNNIACECRAALAELYVRKGDLDRALDWAAEAAGRTPEYEDGHAALGCVLAERQAYDRAAAVFDRLAAMPKIPLRSARNTIFHDGVARLAAAKSYRMMHRLDDAERQLQSIPPNVQTNARIVRPLLDEVSAIQRQRSILAVRGLVTNLLMNEEPQAARQVLDYAPTAVRGCPELNALGRLIDYRLRHLYSWEDYCAAYSSTALKHQYVAPNVAGILGLGRTRAVIEWAEALPAEGDVVRVLSVGPQDCTIERAVMEANRRVHMMLADASESANEAMAQLAADFPGRVERYTVKNFTDWPNGKYDAIFFFEVLEHLPDRFLALTVLQDRLAPQGTLFLSTPIAGKWTTASLANEVGSVAPDGREIDWYWHVDAASPEKLWDELTAAGLDGRLEATDHGRCFLARVRRVDPPHAWRPIAIYVPATPHPFDADTHRETHLGGSEVAVTFLAEALAREGFAVTVYAPRPLREGALFAANGVLWRDVADFDAEGGAYYAVLFWRCPQLVPATRTPYRKLLWLHDATYRCGPTPYKNADAVIVLSAFHAEIIAASDGFTGPFMYGANGIDLDAYPALSREAEALRDPHKVIYTSSPDRGLDQLLLAWPHIRAAVPDATLEICYTWDLLEKRCAEDAAFAAQFGGLRAQAESMVHLGVTAHGGVSHERLAELYHRSSVWAYPCAGRFEVEISCISAMQAQAAGCWPVVTVCGALAETVLDGTRLSTPPPHPLDSAEGAAWYAQHVIDVLKAPPSFAARHFLAVEAQRYFAWSAAARRFVQIIGGTP